MNRCQMCGRRIPERKAGETGRTKKFCQKHCRLVAYRLAARLGPASAEYAPAAGAGVPTAPFS